LGNADKRDKYDKEVKLSQTSTRPEGQKATTTEPTKTRDPWGWETWFANNPMPGTRQKPQPDHTVGKKRPTSETTGRTAAQTFEEQHSMVDEIINKSPFMKEVNEIGAKKFSDFITPKVKPMSKWRQAGGFGSDDDDDMEVKPSGENKG
jgi:hypothetical protein